VEWVSGKEKQPAKGSFFVSKLKRDLKNYRRS
jgi:hypothetical protein